MARSQWGSSMNHIKYFVYIAKCHSVMVLEIPGGKITFKMHFRFRILFTSTQIFEEFYVWKENFVNSNIKPSIWKPKLVLLNSQPRPITYKLRCRKKICFFQLLPRNWKWLLWDWDKYTTNVDFISGYIAFAFCFDRFK